MHHAPRISCAKCGSSNTELRSSHPRSGDSGGQSVISRLSELAFQLLDSGGGHPPQGLRWVVCRDCGHASPVHFN